MEHIVIGVNDAIHDACGTDIVNRQMARIGDYERRGESVAGIYSDIRQDGDSWEEDVGSNHKAGYGGDTSKILSQASFSEV